MEGRAKKERQAAYRWEGGELQIMVQYLRNTNKVRFTTEDFDEVARQMDAAGFVKRPGDQCYRKFQELKRSHANTDVCDFFKELNMKLRGRRSANGDGDCDAASNISGAAAAGGRELLLEQFLETSVLEDSTVGDDSMSEYTTRHEDDMANNDAGLRQLVEHNDWDLVQVMLQGNDVYYSRGEIKKTLMAALRQKKDEIAELCRSKLVV